MRPGSTYGTRTSGAMPAASAARIRWARRSMSIGQCSMSMMTKSMPARARISITMGAPMKSIIPVRVSPRTKRSRTLMPFFTRDAPRRRSIDLHVCALDDLGPLVGLFCDKFAELRRRYRHRLDAEVLELRLDGGIGDARRDRLVELGDDVGGRVLGRADAEVA